MKDKIRVPALNKLAVIGAKCIQHNRGNDSVLVKVNCGTLGKDFLEEVIAKVGFEERLGCFSLEEN